MANRYDINALDNVLNAAVIPAYTGEYKTPKRSTLREYRESGALSRGTLKKMEDVRGEMAKIQPEIDKFNSNLTAAKAAAGDYKTAASAYNAEVDNIDSISARIQSDPTNTGLIKSLGNYQQRMADKSFDVEVSTRKISGGNAIDRPDIYSAPIYPVMKDEAGNPVLDWTGQVTYDQSNGPTGYSRNYTDQARPAMDLSGTGITEKSEAARRASDVAAVATKRDSKRYEAGQGGLLQSPMQDAEQQTSSSPFESQFSSLAKYRKG